MTKIYVASDIHLEFGPMNVNPELEYDIAILPGDIGLGVEGVMWAGKNFHDVVYLAGNHEFYGKRRLHHHYDKMQKKADESKVHFLQNRTVVIGNTRVIGATLWTDFNLSGKQNLVLGSAAFVLNDYRQIMQDVGSENPKYNRPITPYQILEEHNKSISFILDELEKPFDGKTIVATHHAPSFKSINIARYGHDWDTHSLYASNLDGIMEQYGIALWVHGHTHASSDYQVGNTRVISNPRGYVRRYHGGMAAENQEFNPNLVVEI